MEEKFRILIVEDQDKDRRLLRKTLESSGYDIEEAVNGLEGLEMALLHKPGLIISDALMPKMDGFNLLRNLTMNKELKKIPFIFYSATYTSVMDKKLALTLGAMDFIEKPMEPHLLLENIGSFVEEIKTGKEPENVELIEEDEEYLRKYSLVIATKLEEINSKLEKSNESLQLQIIKRKKAESELKKHRDQLEELVNDRTTELEEANKSLYKYIKKLEEYNKLFVDREFRIKELREEVKELEKRLQDK